MNLLLCFLLFNQIEATSVEGGRTSPDGAEEIQIDLPGTQQMKNTGGKDGAGLCVFTSIEHSGRWQNVDSILGLQQKMTREQGGGYPSKVEKMLAKYCDGAQYLQYEGSDPALIKLALTTGRMPSVTYGYSPRYSGKIAHMVNAVHLTEKWAAILDNNFPGDTKYEWMTPAEFKKRWVSGGGGWCVVVLAPPPPPMPYNEGEPIKAYGQKWGTLSSAAVAAPYEWRVIDANQAALYSAGKQLGVWIMARQCYRELLPDGNWSADQELSPFPPPESHLVKVIEQIEQNFGLDRSRLDRGVEKFWLGGREVTRKQAYTALSGAGKDLIDDREKLRLTVIGTAAECQAVVKDLETNPALSVFADTLLVQSYRPDNWAMKDIGFAPGTPRIVVQGGPDFRGAGKVLHSQGDYNGGAQALADALRRVRPDYDPNKDVDKRKTPAKPTAPDTGNSTIALIVMLLAGGLTVAGFPALAALVRIGGTMLTPKAPEVVVQSLKRKVVKPKKKKV
ncbi:hypothetical protein UFOVP1620_35 [uncultured Caudovirales phage]|uniref:Uncharacterized protein n=1 Tax=uncultured Caudovirales phage TaxID=2100421 RepID=A0A6J5T0E1_9CAUD|nr:hypothetical protein UFOVP1620_35 [uncultured Caudovirales phage]